MESFVKYYFRGIIEIIKETPEERKRRRNRPYMECSFDMGVSEQEFRIIAEKELKRIKRINKGWVDGHVVFAIVESNSGISDWKFSIDYNDYGHVTGRYWIISDNKNSKIPESVATRICWGIEQAIIESKRKEDI